MSFQSRGRLARTLLRVLVHLMHLVSNLLGDDWVSKQIRRGLLRALGAHVGPGSSFHGGSYFTVPGRLHVGSRCFINRNCYFDLEGAVTIGDDVVIGHGTTVITSHHHLGPSRRRAGSAFGQPVVIGDGTWIGANVTLMPGVTIHNGAVIGAGSLVLHDVEADTCVVGVPARRSRNLPTLGDEIGRSATVSLLQHPSLQRLRRGETEIQA